MRSVHVVISGRVQGVGYRAWTEDEAAARALKGWVRNRRDGTVEAVFSGEDGDVDDMLEACRQGPGMASVAQLDISDWSGDLPTTFHTLPTL